MWGQIASLVASGIGALSSSNDARDSRDDANQREAEALAFDQQRYDDWQSIYGGLEDNLSNYYNNLNPELYTAVGLEAIELERDSALDAIRTNMAQRGIEDSGLASAANTQLELNTASERARVRREAPEEVAKQKASFLQLGMQSNPDSTISDRLSQREFTAQNNRLQSEQNASQAQGAFTSQLLTGIDDYINRDTSNTDDKYSPPSNASIGGG